MSKMKLTPTFSTTEIWNDISTPVRLDLSIKKIKNIHAFRNSENKQVVCLTVRHPIQKGSTTYFLHDKQDIEKVFDIAKQNHIDVSFA